MSGFADCYRENLHEAQQALDIAERVKESFKREGLIVWGTTRAGFTGWLAKGPKANEAYSTWARAKADVEHWGNLLAAEIKAPTVDAVPIQTALPMTEAEVEARKAEIAAQVAARLGEKLDEEISI